MISIQSLVLYISDMDKEQIVLLAGVTICVISISAFIFWGPSPGNKRRGAVVGLQNLGLTCFLNTLLQSLASCVYFVEWLETCKDQGPVANSLYFVLKVLCCERSQLPVGLEDPLAPTCVISALQQHGWSLGQGEQDAHELFHLLMVTLEEEAHKAASAEIGLTEVLEPKIVPIAEEDLNDNSANLNHEDNFEKVESNSVKLLLARHEPSNVPIAGGDTIDTSTNLNHEDNVEQIESNSIELLHARNEPSVVPIAEGDVIDSYANHNHEDTMVNLKKVESDSVELILTGNEPSGDSAKQSKPVLTPSKLVNRQGEPITRTVVPKYDCNRNYQPSPFCGLLTSQLQCVKCGFKSVLRYDKFDSLSLHLPDRPRVGHTLCQLLSNYTQPEAISGVVCDGCNKHLDSAQPRVTSTSFKTLTVGKLPRCLCIHIHRMSIGSNGSPYKRSDYIDFPEYLIMDPFTYNSIVKEQKLREDGNQPSIRRPVQSLQTNIITQGGSWNHLYRLKAVVVHCGTVDSGHFVTYRRGPLDSSTRHRSDRWYFTSDATVREATMAEAMQALAYMLFYEKCNMIPT